MELNLYQFCKKSVCLDPKATGNWYQTSILLEINPDRQNNIQVLDHRHSIYRLCSHIIQQAIKIRHQTQALLGNPILTVETFPQVYHSTLSCELPLQVESKQSQSYRGVL